jgi:PhnB protein
MIVLNPYISFKGQAREAAEFYKSVFGGELTVSTFKDGGMSHDPKNDELVMHAMLKAENGLTLMVSDTPDSMPYNDGSRISISLSGQHDDEEMLKGYWEKLIDGGKVNQPLEKAPWGDMFGMGTDKFGIDWMVNIEGAKA